jgi:hypothetical protein
MESHSVVFAIKELLMVLRLLQVISDFCQELIPFKQLLMYYWKVSLIPGTRAH